MGVFPTITDEEVAELMRAWLAAFEQGNDEALIDSERSLAMFLATRQHIRIEAELRAERAADRPSEAP